MHCSLFVFRRCHLLIADTVVIKDTPTIVLRFLKCVNTDGTVFLVRKAASSNLLMGFYLD